MVVVDREDIFPGSGVDELAVCTWNMLAPCLHEDHPGSLPWSCRRSAWRQCLERIATCDVLCFQEVDRHCVADELTSMLAANGFAFVAQDGKGRPWGNVTFFKTERLRLAWSASRCRTLLTGFALPSGHVVGIVNVHLEAGIAETNESQRLSMLTSALRRLREYSSSHVIITGDFNCSLQHDSQLRDLLMAEGLNRVPCKGFTFAVQGYADTLDHIWVSESFQAKMVLGSTPEALKSIASEGLPNSEYPSDHLPVAAKFHVQESITQRANASSAESSSIGASCDRSMLVAICGEWLQIIEYARRAMNEGQSKKKAMRDQRDLERAFFDLIGEEAATYVRQWHAGASKAAQSAVAAAVSVAQARMSDEQTCDAQPETCSRRVAKPSEGGAKTLSTRIWDPGILAWQTLMAAFWRQCNHGQNTTIPGGIS